ICSLTLHSPLTLLISYYTFFPLFLLYFHCSVYHRHLHSFPTRRSSDLCMPQAKFDRGGRAGRAPEDRGPGQLQSVEQTGVRLGLDRKSTRLNSSHQIISYAVFCLKKKKNKKKRQTYIYKRDDRTKPYTG